MASTRFQTVYLAFDRVQGTSVRESRARAQEEKRKLYLWRNTKFVSMQLKPVLCNTHLNTSQTGWLRARLCSWGQSYSTVCQRNTSSRSWEDAPFWTAVWNTEHRIASTLQYTVLDSRKQCPSSRLASVEYRQWSIEHFTGQQMARLGTVRTRI